MEQEIFKEALRLILMVSLPPTLVSMFIGLLVGVLQTATQIQEQSISFALKLAGVVVTLVVTAPWYSREFFEFINKAFLFVH
jgi:type III secretion protein S